MSNISKEELERMFVKYRTGVGTVVCGLFLYDIIDVFLKAIFTMLRSK